MTYVIVSSGHLRGLHGLGAAPAPTGVAAVLARSEAALDRLNEQRTRLLVQTEALRVGSLPDIIDITETKARINGMETLIAAIDNFVGGVYIRVEKQAKNPALAEEERMAAAQRLLRATTNILKAAGDTRPLTDLSEDIKEAANGMIKDTRDLLNPGSWDVPVWVYGLAGLAALYMISNMGKR